MTSNRLPPPGRNTYGKADTLLPLFTPLVPTPAAGATEAPSRPPLVPSAGSLGDHRKNTGKSPVARPDLARLTRPSRHPATISVRSLPPSSTPRPANNHVAPLVDSASDEEAVSATGHPPAVTRPAPPLFFGSSRPPPANAPLFGSPLPSPPKGLKPISPPRRLCWPLPPRPLAHYCAVRPTYRVPPYAFTAMLSLSWRSRPLPRRPQTYSAPAHRTPRQTSRSSPDPLLPQSPVFSSRYPLHLHSLSSRPTVLSTYVSSGVSIAFPPPPPMPTSP